MKKSSVLRIIHTIKKLTVLDWVVCLLLLGIVAFFLIIRTTKEQRWVGVTVRVSGDEWYYNLASPEHWYAEGLADGQAAYNSFGKKIAEVLSVENYDVGGPHRLIVVNLKLLTTFNKKINTYSFNYQVLQVGKPLDFTFGRYNLHGLVTYIGSTSIPYVTTDLEVKLHAIYPWEADSYKPELQMKDLEGNTVATIKSVEIQSAQVLELKNNYGDLVVVPFSYNSYKDVTIRLVIKSYMINGASYYIDGTAIKIGNRIWIEFEHTAVKDAIISKVY